MSLFDFICCEATRTSCYFCDYCNRTKSLMELCYYRAYYKGTDIPSSLVEKTDLVAFFSHEPVCDDCANEWINNYTPCLEFNTLKSVIIIQKWYRHNKWKPDSKEYFNLANKQIYFSKDNNNSLDS